MKGLGGPRLDDRTYADLMREAEAFVRRKAPGWTDFSAGDPGVTLIELVAYLTDILLYRLNRVPEKVHVALLNLLGVTQLAPSAATVLLTFSREDGETDAPVTIPAGTRVRDPSGAVVFETLTEASLGATPVEVPALHAELVEGEPVGVGTGEAGQQVTLRRAPVIRNADVDRALAVGVELGDDAAERYASVVSDSGKSFVIWREVASFHELGPDDRVYVADRASGRINFGQGGNGAAPPAGAAIRAWYRRGGGRSGNVAADTLTVLTAPIAGVTVTNRERAVGGEDGESVADVVARGQDAVRVLRTAVTARDFERVALEAGGIARARASALRELWSFARPGVVDLQVVPRVDRSALDEGAVTLDVLAAHERGELLARVDSLLSLKRPLGVETRTSFTRCRPVSVAARVVVSRAESPSRVAERLRRRLNDLLAPQGQWPHGKMLRASDVYEALLSEPSVRYAETVKLTIDDAPGSRVATLVRDPHMPRMLFAGTETGLFRSQELARGWEKLKLPESSEHVAAVALHPEVPGLVAAAAVDGSIHRLIVSADAGETWTVAEQLQNEPVYGLAWLARGVGRPVLFIATRRALRRLEIGAGGGSNNLQELTADGGGGDSGFFAVAAARHPADVSLVAIAARELSGVLVSHRGGAPRSFELIPGSAGKDVRSLAFHSDGDRMFLWAGMAAAAGAEGDGLMRVEARTAGLDPGGWQRFDTGWRGGSCEAFDVTDGLVAAATNRGGVLTLDLARQDARWSASPLDSGLPINNERSALLPVTAVATAIATTTAATTATTPGAPAPTIVAGTGSGLYVGQDGVRFETAGSKTFTDAVPLPKNWLYCSGEHVLDVVTDAEARGDA